MIRNSYKQQSNPVEVLGFRRGDEWATIVTDGVQTRVFKKDANIPFPTLIRAIGALEADGFSIDMDNPTIFKPKA